jgi:hypothetical protein
MIILAIFQEFELLIQNKWKIILSTLLYYYNCNQQFLRANMDNL